MVLKEKEIEYLEEQIPLLAESATRQAYWQTLASGDSVLIAKDGKIVEMMPDGTEKFVKEIAKPQIVYKKRFIIPKK